MFNKSGTGKQGGVGRVGRGEGRGQQRERIREDQRGSERIRERIREERATSCW